MRKLILMSLVTLFSFTFNANADFYNSKTFSCKEGGHDGWKRIITISDDKVVENGDGITREFYHFSSVTISQNKYDLWYTGRHGDKLQYGYIPKGKPEQNFNWLYQFDYSSKELTYLTETLDRKNLQVLAVLKCREI